MDAYYYNAHDDFLIRYTPPTVAAGPDGGFAATGSYAISSVHGAQPSEPESYTGYPADTREAVETAYREKVLCGAQPITVDEALAHGRRWKVDVTAG